MESEGLKVFLKSVGNAVYSLNTICVGLDSIYSDNFSKPKKLTITWKTNNPKESAISARSFAIRSSLVFVQEALLEYLKYLKNSPDQDSKIVEALDSDGAAKIIENLSNRIDKLENYWVSFVVLLIRWRNLVVHNSKTDLSSQHIKVLHENSEIIKEMHSGIDVRITIGNFKSNKITLKDFTTMIAITLKYVRYIDANLIPNITNPESLAKIIRFKEIESEYKQVVGVNGLEKQRNKFETFLRTNLQTIDKTYYEVLFEERFNILN